LAKYISLLSIKHIECENVKAVRVTLAIPKASALFALAIGLGRVSRETGL